MIREFWVENYLSIKDRQTINFETKSKDDDDLLSIEVSNGIRLNKIGIMYGANASGKSNMLSAIQTVFDILRSARNDVRRSVPAFFSKPFALTADKPTKLYVSFYKDTTRYDYMVVYHKYYIEHEELYYYPRNSKALFYERDFVSTDSQADIKFGQSINLKAKTTTSIVENTLNNHSVLSTFSKQMFTDDAKPLRDLYNWIVNHYHPVKNFDKEQTTIVNMMKDACEDEKKKKFYLQMLKKADFNIVDFRYDRQDRIIENETNSRIAFLNDSASGKFEVIDMYQSEGTISYLSDIRWLYDTLTGDHVYLLDEFGRDYHYDLLLYYLNVFLYNSEKSQLIFTSQERELLLEDLLNSHRDIVWFVEKSAETAASSFTRADQFGLHKNLSLYNSYKIGRLGAKPELGSPYILID